MIVSGDVIGGRSRRNAKAYPGYAGPDPSLVNSLARQCHVYHGSWLLARVVSRETGDVLLAQHVGHCGHLRALARALAIGMQHLLQIVCFLRRQGWRARVGAIAVDAMTTVAALRPFGRSQGLAYLGRLRRLVCVKRG